MKKNIFIKALSFLAVGYGMASCLDGDPMNTPPGASPPLVEMSYVLSGGTQLNSGLTRFPQQALLLGPADEADTITFAVTVQGNVDRDVNVTLQLDPNAINDATDGVEYAYWPADEFQLLNTTATIPQGKNYAEFQIVFFPPKIDFAKSYMLPITATNDAGYVTSSNFGKLYFHQIGNAIAGVYTWDFIRCSDPACSAGPDGQTKYGRTTVLAPQDPTTVTVPTGYFSQPNYIITFKQDADGTLHDFRAILDPVALAADWDTNNPPIVVASGPTILAENNNTKFTLHYTTGTRNVTDIFTKK